MHTVIQSQLGKVINTHLLLMSGLFQLIFCFVGEVLLPCLRLGPLPSATQWLKPWNSSQGHRDLWPLLASTPLSLQREMPGADSIFFTCSCLWDDWQWRVPQLSRTANVQLAAGLLCAWGLSGAPGHVYVRNLSVPRPKIMAKSWL